jgi:radical SAM protein with 4Fe4S-binding SPASM domain
VPNILLTQRCVRACPYCFADKHMSESAPDDVLSWENLIYLADFLQAGGEKRFPILGGEPTLHPDFVHMVLYLLERGFQIHVFTSGVMSNEKLDQAAAAFRDLPFERLSFVCNLNDPAKTRSPLAEVEAVKRFLATFGERVVPGFNIYRTDFELDFLLRWINDYGLRRTIRLGLAHPIAGQKNLSIALEDVDQVIERVFSYRHLFARMRVKPGLDCGFPLCRFRDDQLAWLYRETHRRYDFGCAPVIDIGPDMNVWSCFPLSSFHRRSLFEFNSLDEVRQHYEKLHDQVRVETGGIYEECDSCPAREDKLCMGGCLAHAVAHFQHEPRVRMKEVYL